MADACPILSGDPEASAQTWVGSLLQSALANVTVRVKNSVVKYIADGAVATVSVESAVAYSVGKDWQQAFTDPLLGLRRMCALNNISVCLDELDPFGRVAEYQEALLKERSVTVRLSLVPARGGNKARRCEAEVVVGPLDASVSNSQLEQLRRIVSGFRSGSGEVRGSAQNGTEKKEAEEKDADGSSAEVTRVARKDKDRSGLQSKALEAEENRQSSDESDGSGEDDLDERNPDERNPDGSGHDPLKSSALVQAAAAGWRPIGWAWNFLANEEATAGAAEAAAQRREALQQMEEEADVLGLLGSGGPLDLAFRLKLTGGEVKLRHVPPPTVEKTSVRRSDAGRALSEEDEASEKDDDSMTVVDKAVIEQSLSPPTAGVFIPTPDLFSSLPDVRSPHFRATEPGAKARFAVLSWGGLSVDVDVAQEALRSVSVRLDWAQVTKPNDGTSDVLLAILPDREGGKVAVRRRLSFPGSPFSNPGVDSAKPSSKLNAHAEKSRATEEQRPTPSVATKFQSASSSLALPQFATPSAESPFNEATSPERKALQITWQSGERPTNLGDVRNDGAPRLQAVVGHVAVAYSPGLVAGLKSFLNRGRNGMEPADVIVGQDDDDGLGRGREAGSSEDVSTAERSAPGGYSEADGTVIKSPLPEESSRPGKIPFFGRVRESASGLPAFEVSVDSCELAAVGADSEAGSPAVVLCTGQLECRFSDVLDGAKEVEGGGGRAVKVVLREVKADAVPDWAHQQVGDGTVLR